MAGSKKGLDRVAWDLEWWLSEVEMKLRRAELIAWVGWEIDVVADQAQDCDCDEMGCD